MPQDCKDGQSLTSSRAVLFFYFLDNWPWSLIFLCGQCQKMKRETADLRLRARTWSCDQEPKTWRINPQANKYLSPRLLLRGTRKLWLNVSSLFIALRHCWAGRSVTASSWPAKTGEQWILFSFFLLLLQMGAQLISETFTPNLE